MLGRSDAHRLWVVGGVLLAGATAWLYAPALSLQLMGDDYQWVHHTHRALQRPALLVADLDSFLRPASTWTLVLDRLAWPWWPGGYHLTNLVLHLAAALLLVGAGRRLGLSPPATLVVGGLWAVAPWASESAIQVAIRFESLLLLAWCGVVVGWPRAEDGWGLGRTAAVAGALTLAAASKETWVVTPGLVWALERCLRGRRGVQALSLPALVTAAVLLYTSAYFALFPSDKGYFRWEGATFAKLPQQFAGFFFLAPHRPAEFELSWAQAVATLAIAGLAWMAWRTASPAMVVGLALLWLTSLPTLAVPYLPLRHCAAPYAGFLLLLAGMCTEVGRRAQPHLRRWATVGVAAGVVLTAAAHAAVVRAELEDARRLSAAHARLLEQAHLAADALRPGVPMLVVRADPGNALRDIALTPRGWPKLLYVRQQDPGGLIDAAALFWWVRRELEADVVRLDSWDSPAAQRPGGVLVYTGEGFTLAALVCPNVGAEAQRLTAGGAAVRVIELRPLQRN